MKIRRLSEGTINRIAAARWWSAPPAPVKELVENALDAGASHIDVAVSNGGCDLVLVEDDGEGMEADDLVLAVERHATSKLGGDDLSHIVTMGFRGEALPVDRRGGAAFHRQPQQEKRSARSARRWRACPRADARGLSRQGPIPAPGGSARVVLRHTRAAEILKSARSEDLATQDTVKRLAMSRADVAFTLTLDGKRVLDLPAEADLFAGRLKRLSRIMGREFADNALPSKWRAKGCACPAMRAFPPTTAPMRKCSSCSSTDGRCATNF